MPQNNENERLQQAADECYYSNHAFARESFIEGANWQKKDAIKNATTEELKAELKRRVELAKAQKAEEMKNALRCRNCKYYVLNPNCAYGFLCMARTWGKKIIRHYCVKPCTKACNKFERKMED